MQPVSVSLQPELQHLEIVTGYPAGKVLLDGQEAGILQMGQFSKDDLSLGQHTIQVMDAGRDIVNVQFSVSAAQPPRLSSPVKGNVVVVSAFGSAGKVYAGSKLLLQDKSGTPQPIPAEGLDVALGGADLVVTDGKRQQNLTFEAVNYPLLAIHANGDTDTRPLLFIDSKLENPELSINGKPAAWRVYKGRLRGRLDPGTYVIRVSNPGYEPAETTVTLAKGDRKALELELKQLPVTSSLVIDGGVAGTEVVIDGSVKGTLDPNGHLSLAQLSPGNHEIVFRKENYESRRYIKPLKAAQPFHIPEAEARLIPFGGLQFHMTPASAAITYKRKDESEWYKAQNNGTVPLQEGNYTIRASAEGYESKVGEWTVGAANTSTLNWVLTKTNEGPPEPKPVASGLSQVENHSEWYDQGGWIMYQGQGYGWIRSPQGSFSVDVRKKSGGIFTGGSDFVVGFTDGGRDKIVYHVGKDGWLSRKMTADGRTEQSRSTVRLAGADSYRLLITIDPKRVTIRNAANVVMDECPVDFDLTAGKFGFKPGFFINIVRR